MVTKEPVQYIGDEATREALGRPEPVPSAAQGSVNLGILALGHLSLAALGYVGTLLAATALVGLVFAARLPLGVTDREALPESPVERRSDLSAPKVSPCPQP